MNHKKLDIKACPESLLRDLETALKSPWLAHVNSADYHGEWDVLPLRCQQGYLDKHPILQAFSLHGCSEWVDMPILETCPTFTEVLSWLDCHIGAVRLMRLKRGAEILPHRDVGLGSNDLECRLHMPVVTSDKVEFVVAGERVFMRPGELWYINADEIHSVKNNSSVDRVHLVIDCEINDYLRSKIF